MKKKIILTSFAMGLAILSLSSCKKKDTTTNKDDSKSDTNNNDNTGGNTNKSDTVAPYTYDETKPYYSATFYDSAYDTDENGALRKDNDGCYTLTKGKKISSFICNVGQKLTWLPTPVKEGYTFAGWYVDQALSTPFYYNEMPSGDLEVYARWQIDNDVIYVSPTGLPTNDGKKKSSAMSLLEASRVYKPGATIKVLQGTYKDKNTVVFGAQGDANHITTIEGEGTSNTVLSFEYQTEADANQGLKVAGDYHRVSNLTVANAGDNGLLLGSSNNIISNCVFTGNHDTGLQIGRFSGTLQPTIDYWPSNNLVLNCTSYNNCDEAGEDADGFAAKLTVGYNNVFDGCLSYWNVDDGWDLYAKQDSGRIGLVRIQNCVAFQNGKHLKSDGTGLDEKFAGDGNGFKLGGTSVPCEVIVDNCISAYNYAHGFTDNSNPGHIAISNCTSINNGQFASNPDDAATYKEYDNFNLNRDSIIANKNYYSNLISYYTSNSTNKKVGSDEFNGSISNVIMIQNNESYIADGALSAQSGEGFITSKNVNKWTDPDTNKSVDDTNPTSLISKYGTTNFHEVLRNSDNSLNISTLWSVSDKVKNQISVGANLNKSSSASYSHYEFAGIVANETADQTTAREVLDSIDLAINKDLIFNDIYLPTSMRGTSISWSSSNTDALSISNDETKVENGLNYRYGILNPRLTMDTNVTLTATFSVGGVTYTKSFTVTCQALDPRVGEVSGIDNTTILDSEIASFDLNSYIVKDYTSTTLTLNENTDYTATTTIKYVDDFMSYEDALKCTKYTTVSSLNAHGTYLIEYRFKIDGYNDVVKQRIVTIVNTSDTYEVTTASAYLNSIINNNISITGDASYGSGTLYAVAVARGSDAPTALEIKSQSTSFIGTLTASLSSRDFTIDLAVKENVAVDVYMVVENSTGLGTVYSIKDAIEPAVKITDREGLIKALSSESGAYVLENDINCDGFTFSQSKDSSKKFKGYFDGNGHTIKNLKISVAGEGGGLFYKATGGAIIKNIVLEEVHVTQSDISSGNGGKTAILVGCAEEGDVTIDSVVIKNCSVNAYQRAAGIIGEIKGLKNVSASKMPKVSITNCAVISNEREYYIRSVYESEDSNHNKIYTGGKYVGGVVAHVQYGAHLTIDNCFVKQNIQACNQYSGGIVGRLDPQTADAKISITNTVFAGNLNSSSSYAGGILGGRSSGVVTVKNCVTLGGINASSSGAIVSTNLCTSTTVGNDKVYKLNQYITFENNYRQISDYDGEGDYTSEEEYLQKMTLNQEWQGTAVYYSTMLTEAWWNEHMADFMKSFDFKLNENNWTGLYFFLK